MPSGIAFTDESRVLESCVVEIDSKSARDGMIEGIKYGEKSFGFEMRIHVQHPVEISCIGATAVDEVTFQNISMCLEPFDLGFDLSPSDFGIVEARASIAGLDTEGEIAL